MGRNGFTTPRGVGPEGLDSDLEQYLPSGEASVLCVPEHHAGVPSPALPARLMDCIDDDTQQTKDMAGNDDNSIAVIPESLLNARSQPDPGSSGYASHTPRTFILSVNASQTIYLSTQGPTQRPFMSNGRFVRFGPRLPGWREKQPTESWTTLLTKCP
jgi:hypothetical protein